MNLFFTCPIKKEKFSSEAYSLQQGHRIVEDKNGEKALQGTVSLTSPCPLCGEQHLFEVEDVLCPLSGGRDAR